MLLSIRTSFAAILLGTLFMAGCDFNEDDDVFIDMTSPTLGQELTTGQSFQISGVVRSGGLVDRVEIGLYLAQLGDVDTLAFTVIAPPSPVERLPILTQLTVPDEVETGEDVLYFVSIEALGATLSREVLIEEAAEE